MRRWQVPPQFFRPLKGWRVFAGEVGVVLLGVLLALGAQQLAEEFDRRQNRAFTEQALKDEIAFSAGYAFERLVIEPCLKSRLRELNEKLAANANPWRGTPAQLGKVQVAGTRAFPAVYRTPSREWPTNAWTTATASGVLLHMDRARVAQFGDIYSQIRNLGDAQDAEETIAPNLSFLASDQRLEPATRVAAQTVLAQLDTHNEMIVTIAHQMLDAVRALRLGYSPADISRSSAEVVNVQRAYRGACARDLRLNL